MNILLTNDDGIEALGIKKLEELLSKYGNVYVVAPLYGQSGKACSINAHFGIKVKLIDDKHIAVEGSPVDCVEIASSVLNVKFDLIVSGCNNGYNLAHDVMYSGTCGACIQATFANLKSIAISCANNDFLFMLDKHLDKVLEYIFKNKLLSKKYFLNINFPTNENIKGIKLTKIAEPIHEKYSYEIIDGNYVVSRQLLTKNDVKGSDVKAINDGYVSITPLSQTIFKKSDLLKLKNNKIMYFKTKR